MPTLKVISAPQSAQANAARRRAAILNGSSNASMSHSNFSSYDDLFYRGRQDRIDRYRIYDVMDEDVDVSRALDMIAEHCTNESPVTELPFVFQMDSDEIGAEDSDLLYTALYQWDRINHWKMSLWRVIRNTIKYGDAFFIRDPDTFKLHQIAAAQVVGIYVDRDDRSIQAYHFRDLNFVLEGVMNFSVPQQVSSNAYSTQRYSTASAVNEVRKDALVMAENVLHISMSEGAESGGNGQNDDIWPFGESFLEQIYKDYRKREALETAAIIHRMQRAPSRRVWSIDVGKMRPDQIKSYMKRYKDELLHKRIPTKSGGTDQLDALYNPVSMMEDIFIPVTAGGRGSKVENLEGTQWNGLNDLEYFNSKLIRGLRIPTSFMLGPEEGGQGGGNASFSDGRVGTAYIQELQFAKFCRRIQDLVIEPLNKEFKRFLKIRGVQVDSGDYDLGMSPPINFEEYREGALNADRLQRLSSAMSFPFIAKRFAMKKYAGMSQDEILENERLWAEENVPGAVRGDAQSSGYGGMNVGGGFPLGGADSFGSGPDSFGNDMAGTPGMSDITGSASASPGSDAGSAGGLGGMGTTPPGTEGRMASGTPLFEQYASPRSVARSKRVPSEAKPLLEGRHKDRSQPPNEPDRLFMAGDGEPIGSRPVLTLKLVRKMRMEKERARRELVKRLELAARMYPQQSGGSSF